MSGISSGIGLISGINSADLIEKLMAIEARPLEQLSARVKGIDARRTAFLELSAKLLAVRGAITGFGRALFFKRFSATSTNEAIVKATATETALPGSTTLRVHSLVSNHSLISRGFADADRTPVGAGTLTFESGRAKVNGATQLDLLNGGAGVRRGVITITDASGATADIDLGTALTVDDVLSAINNNAKIHVRAGVTGVAFQRSDGTVTTGDRIVLEDATSGDGNLTVTDRTGGFAALDLGIAGSAVGGRLDGRDLIRLTAETPLSLLNDRNGVGRFRIGADLIFHTELHGDLNVSLGDILAPETDLRALNGGRGVRLGVIRITDRIGKSVDVDLTSLADQVHVTVQDIRQKITESLNAAGVKATITFVNSSLLISDTNQGLPEDAPPLIVEDLPGGTAAADLGIAAKADNGAIFGRAIYRVATVGDAIRAINYAQGNDGLVEASISQDGKGIALRALGDGNGVTVEAGVAGGRASTAARDLGIAGAAFFSDQPFTSRRLIAGLNTVLLHSLRGGQGLEAGTVSLADRSGQSAEIDLSSATTLQEIVDLINADRRTSIRASIADSGNRLVLSDGSGGAGPIVVADASGALAAQLGLSGSHSAATIKSANLQLQYVSHTTRLTELNDGRGVSAGDFQITDSTGAVFTVNVPRGYETVGEVIDAINNSAPATLRARINDKGDGILITDTAGGAKSLKINDLDGRTAADLRLAGSAKTGETFIDGSFEIQVALNAGDTLRSVADKINASGAQATASLVNDGNLISPFSLTIASKTSGRRGELVVDMDGVDLGLQTLSLAKDAVVSIGGSQSLRPRVVSSSSNQLRDVISGVTFDLLGTGEQDVTVTVAQDQAAIMESVGTFVEKFNDVLDSVAGSTSFNAETFVKGTLFGDSTVSFIQRRLQRVILQPFNTGDASTARLSSVGLRLGTGGRLEFDEEQFREAYERAPQSVEALFTKEETGVAAVLQKALDELTGGADGALPRKDELLGDQRDLLTDRIEGMSVLLAAKRARLEAQFATLESVLAGLQGQQSALVGLQQLVQNL